MAANSLFNITLEAPQAAAPSYMAGMLKKPDAKPLGAAATKADAKPFGVAATKADAAAHQTAVLSPVTPAPSNSVGVITTQQSVITFAGAPAAVTLVWKVIGVAAPSLASLTLLPIVLSIVVGMLIYWQSAPVEGTRKQKIIGFAFAIINSFAIAAATLGIVKTA